MVVNFSIFVHCFAFVREKGGDISCVQCDTRIASQDQIIHVQSPATNKQYTDKLFGKPVTLQILHNPQGMFSILAPSAGFFQEKWEKWRKMGENGIPIFPHFSLFFPIFPHFSPNGIPIFLHFSHFSAGGHRQLFFDATGHRLAQHQMTAFGSSPPLPQLRGLPPARLCFCHLLF